MADTVLVPIQDEVDRLNALHPAANAGDNPVAKEVIVRKLDTLRREVAGPHPSTLERLLADRVAIGWLALTLAEGS